MGVAKCGHALWPSVAKRAGQGFSRARDKCGQLWPRFLVSRAVPRTVPHSYRDTRRSLQNPCPARLATLWPQRVPRCPALSRAVPRSVPHVSRAVPRCPALCPARLATLVPHSKNPCPARLATAWPHLATALATLGHTWPHVPRCPALSRAAPRPYYQSRYVAYIWLLIAGRPAQRRHTTNTQCHPTCIRRAPQPPRIRCYNSHNACAITTRPDTHGRVTTTHHRHTRSPTGPPPANQHPATHL